MDLFHKRMGHSSEDVLRQLIRDDMAVGVGNVSGHVLPCDACQLGKLTRGTHPRVPFGHGATRPIQLVVLDLAGAVKPTSHGGLNYIHGILDIFTRFSWAIPIKLKSDAALKIMEWKAMAENQCIE